MEVATDDPPGRRLQRKRELAGLSRQKLADAAQVGLNTVRNAELGIYTPTLPTQTKLAAAIGARPEDFWPVRLTAIQRRRGERDMSVTELAARAGVARCTIARLENNPTYRARPSVALRIARALDLPVEDVLPPLPIEAP